MVLDGGNWDDELGKWIDPWNHDRFTQVSYSGLTARVKSGRKSKTGQDIYTATPRPKEEYRRDWGTLILDEAHYVKGRKTSWTEATLELAKTAEQVFLATGTAIPNWADELFVPLQLLFPEEAKPGGRFGSYWRWVGEWFDVSPSRFGGAGARDVGDLRACAPACLQRPATDPCDHYHRFVESNLGDRFRMRLRDDVLTDLPPLTQQVVECRMTPAQDKAYREMKKEYVASAGAEELVAWNSGSKETYLHRLTTGLEAATEGRERGSGKLERLRWDLSSRNRPTFVVCHYRDTVDACAEVARSIGARTVQIDGRLPREKRLKPIRDFQEGRADVLVASIETVAEGLTLTQADMCIFVEKSFKPSRNEQAMRRIHRIGQTRPVSVLDYVAVTAKGGATVDGAKREVLATKIDRAIRYMTAAQFARLL